MSTFQRLTLIGMYNYDNTLFSNLTLPEGFDTSTFIDTLLFEHGEKCVLYTDIDFMKYSIGAVSRKWALELSRIYDALTAEYNPIHNYDRTETITDSRGKKFNSKTSADYTDKRTDDLTRTDSQTVAGTTERDVSAFDSSTYSPSEKNTYNNGTTQVKDTGTQETRHAGTLGDTSGGETENYSHNAHMYGNIGVTTSVQMWSEEVKARFNTNLYGIAADIFARELTLAIY